MNPLEEAIRNENTNQLRLLLDLGHDVNKKTEDGKSMLHLAIAESFSLEIIELLLEYDTDVNAKDKDGRTPLFGALSKGVAEILIKNGSDPKILDKYGNCSLHHLANNSIHSMHSNYNNPIELYDYLLDKGLNKHLKNNKDETVFSIVYDYIVQINVVPNKDILIYLFEQNLKTEEYDTCEKNILFDLLSFNDYHHKQSGVWYREEIIQKAIDLGVDVNFQNLNGITPLHEAAKGNAKKVADMLIANGAGVNIVDNEGRTPLFHAVEQNAKAVIALMLEHGADPKFLPIAEQHKLEKQIQQIKTVKILGIVQSIIQNRTS